MVKSLQSTSKKRKVAGVHRLGDQTLPGNAFFSGVSTDVGDVGMTYLLHTIQYMDGIMMYHVYNVCIYIYIDPGFRKRRILTFETAARHRVFVRCDILHD